jgi:KAP family P-loop domain
MWPDNETDVDLLGFDILADGLVVALTEPRLLPLTVGVLGDWGSGKTSLMGLACAELTAEAAARYACVRFSPWQYEDYDDVKVALMAAVLAELGEQAAGDAEKEAEVGRLKAFLLRFGRRSRRVARGGVGLLPASVPVIAHTVDPSADPALVMLAQQGAATAAGGLAGRLADPAPPADDEPVTDVGEFRSRFAALVGSLTDLAAVVVFIDDLDRCLPETVVDTFEAIRLLLDAPRTAFVVAANQKIVESAVDARYPELRGDGRSHGIGAQYLEKMLQLKIVVPALAVPEAVTYVNLLLAELHLPAEDFARLRDHVAAQRVTDSLGVAFNLGTLGDLGLAVPSGLSADLQWAAAIAPVLARGSRGNPRQIKRFLNTLQLRRRAAERKHVSLEPAVLGKLMLLEDQHFSEFQQLFDWQVASGGPSCPQLAAAEALARAGDDNSPAAAATAAADPGERTADTPSRPARSRVGQQDVAQVADAVDDEVRSWAAREAVMAWLGLPPALKEVDLRPYFTYSRGQLALNAVAAGQLSAAQQSLLSDVLGSTDAVRRRGLRRLSGVDPRDRDPVIEALAETLLTTPDDAFVAVCETVDQLPGSRDVLFRALQRLPPEAVPAQHVAVVARRLPADDARTTALLDSWASSGRDDLARMVALARRTGTPSR